MSKTKTATTKYRKISFISNFPNFDQNLLFFSLSFCYYHYCCLSDSKNWWKTIESKLVNQQKKILNRLPLHKSIYFGVGCGENLNLLVFGFQKINNNQKNRRRKLILFLPPLSWCPILLKARKKPRRNKRSN